MMETLISWILEHAGHAHWIIFGSILLAGFNIPISADLVVIAAAILAATIVPENFWLLYGSIFFGCLFSAQIAYWMGRLVGPHLQKWRLFSNILSPQKLEKIQNFYNRYGLLTLIIGRFIPFGVRNAIFMSTGMSKISFGKFALRDLLACAIWTGVCFSCFYALGNNYELIKQFLRSSQIILFSAFGVTVIGIIWYKKMKKAKSA